MALSELHCTLGPCANTLAQLEYQGVNAEQHVLTNAQLIALDMQHSVNVYCNANNTPAEGGAAH